MVLIIDLYIAFLIVKSVRLEKNFRFFLSILRSFFEYFQNMGNKNFKIPILSINSIEYHNLRAAFSIRYTHLGVAGVGCAPHPGGGKSHPNSPCICLPRTSQVTTITCSFTDPFEI